MAKKATKVKRKTASAKTKARTAKPAEPVVPTYLEAGASIHLGLHDVIRALKMIEKHGHLNKLVSAARRRPALVRLPAETVNFVKDFVVANGMHKDPVGKHIVNGRGTPSAAGAMGAATIAEAGDPNGCNFGSLGRG
jgi:hypothetical protein